MSYKTLASLFIVASIAFAPMQLAAQEPATAEQPAAAPATPTTVGKAVKPAKPRKPRRAKAGAATAPVTYSNSESRHAVCLAFIQRHGLSCDPWTQPTCGYDIGYMRPMECVAP